MPHMKGGAATGKNLTHGNLFSVALQRADIPFHKNQEWKLIFVMIWKKEI